MAKQPKIVAAMESTVKAVAQPMYHLRRMSKYGKPTLPKMCAYLLSLKYLLRGSKTQRSTGSGGTPESSQKPGKQLRRTA